MNLLDGVLGTRSKVAILRTLVHHPRHGFTGHELAHIVKMSPNTVHKAIRELCAAGLVDITGGRNAHEIRLADETQLAGSIKQLFVQEGDLKGQLVQVMSKALASHPVTALLFGSAARSEATASSDLDLLVVASSHDDAVEAALVAQKAARKVVPNPVKSIHLTYKELPGHWNEPWFVSAREEGVPLTKKRLGNDP